LTGIYSPTSGNAWVSGNSIQDNIQKVQQLIGFCPQFDILWSELTVEEHLRFYSRLKNVDQAIANQIVEKTLEDTRLTKFRSFLVKELSGGMKRRLSLGISLVGNPSVVFLDEPTTGLDPENKRQIWEILSNCKDGKCMILTTHIMEEAEVLTDRIGIIVNGELKCLGSKFKLKRVYGRGFKLVINTGYSVSQNEDIVNNEEPIDERNLVDESQKLFDLLKSKFPSIENTEKYKNTLVFVINNEEFDAELLFQVITDNRTDMKIVNWAISQVSLEDIFIKLTENDIYT
jgi:ABC-type multidrug transport system ATPase subunit